MMIIRRSIVVVLVLLAGACGGGSSADPTNSVAAMPGRSVASVYRVDASGEVAWAAAAGDIQRKVVVAGDVVVVAAGSRNVGSWLQAFDFDSGDPMWRVDFGKGGFTGGLIVAGDVVVAFNDGGGAGHVYEAFDPATGESLWQRKLSGQTGFGAAVADGFLILSDPRADQVVALDPATGKERWVQTVRGVSANVPVVRAGTIIVNSLTNLYALAVESGEVAWVAHTSGDIDSLVVFRDGFGAITFGQSPRPNMALEMFDGRRGAKRWSFINPNISVPPQSSSPLGQVLVLTAPDSVTGATVVMLNAQTGNTVWAIAHKEGARGPAIVLASGNVLIASDFGLGRISTNSAVALLDGMTGEVIWEVEISGTVRVPPTSTATSILLPTQTGDGSAGGLVALDAASGDELWSIDMELPPLNSPTVADDSVLIGGAHRVDLGFGVGSGGGG